MSNTADFEELIQKKLQDPIFAAEYLNGAIESGDKELLLLSLEQIMKSKSYGQKNKSTNSKSENYFKSMSEKSTQELTSIVDLLTSVGLKLSVLPLS